MMQLVEDFSAIVALLFLVSFHPHRSLWGRQDECYHAHFTDGETKAQKGNNLPTCKVGKVDSKNRKRIILLPVLWMTMKVLLITYEINAMTIALTSHASEVMLKVFQARVSSNWIENFQMHKLGLEKAEKPKIKSPTSLDHREARKFQKHISFCFIDYVQRRQWHPTPVLSPGKPHGCRSLVGCKPWGRWESDKTERLHFHFSLSCIGEGNGNPLQCSCLENPRDGGAW